MSRHRRSNANYQPALDGIRAFAVLGVLLYHGDAGWMRGGFLGVDVFFVLSGFLITGLLLTEWRQWHGLNLPAFWTRRARRLLPALFLMLLAVAFYARFLADPSQRSTLRGDALATVGYVANWRFVFSHQSYFAQFADPSPLRHTWSLAIEEQWYLLFPPVLAGCLLLSNGRTRALRWGFAVAAVGSATLMAVLYSPHADPSRDYYGTDTRVQALLVGAALAMAAEGRRTRPSAATVLDVGGRHLRMPGRNAWELGGAAALLLLFVVGRENAEWLYRGGFLVVAILSTVVVAAAVRPDSILRRLLAFEPLRLVGLISYGLYIWHWPVDVIMSPERTGIDGVALLVLRLAATFAVAAASYVLVEQPIRHGRLAWPRRPAATRVAMAGATVGVLGVTLLATTGAVALPSAGTGTGLTSVGAPLPGHLHVLVVGDSVGYSLANGFPKEDLPGVQVSSSTQLGCGIAVQQIVIESTVAPLSQSCAGWEQAWKLAADTAKPDVAVLVVGSWEIYDHLVSGRVLRVGSAAYRDYLLGRLEAAVHAIGGHGTPVAVLNVPCYDQPSYSPQGVDTAPDRNDPRRSQWLNDAVLARLASSHPGQVHLIDDAGFLCPGGRYTKSLRGGTMRADGVHFTAHGAQVMWQWMLPQLEVLAARTPNLATTPR